MNKFSRNIGIILRTERMIARRHAALLLNQAGLYAMAALVALIGLVMINIALYYALGAHLSPQGAALAVALANIALAGVLVLVAKRQTPGEELEPVTELRDLAIAELESDVEQLATEARAMSNDLRRLARDPLGTLLPSMLGPLLAVLLRGKKK